MQPGFANLALKTSTAKTKKPKRNQRDMSKQQQQWKLKTTKLPIKKYTFYLPKMVTERFESVQTLGKMVQNGRYKIITEWLLNNQISMFGKIRAI